MIRSMGQRMLSYGLVIALCALTTASFSVSAEATSSSTTSSASQKSASPQEKSPLNADVVCTPDADPEPSKEPTALVANNDCFKLYVGQRYWTPVINNDQGSYEQVCDVGPIPPEFATVKNTYGYADLTLNPTARGTFSFSYSLCDETGVVDTAIAKIRIVTFKKVVVKKLPNRRLTAFNPNMTDVYFQRYTEKKGYFNSVLAPGATKNLYAISKVTNWRAFLTEPPRSAGSGVLRY